MILSNCLVPNTKQPYGMSNGWKLFLPYSEKMMCMIRDEKVLMQGVDISFLTVRTLEGNGHLLWNVASDKETNSLIKKNGYEHVDRNIIIKERRPILFFTLQNQCHYNHNEIWDRLCRKGVISIICLYYNHITEQKVMRTPNPSLPGLSPFSYHRKLQLMGQMFLSSSTDKRIIQWGI